MIRHTLRRLLRARTFALAATATLTLGIGGTAAVFTLVNGVLLRPMPFDRADRLVDLSHTLVVSGLLHVDQSDATYLLYRRDNHAFTDVGAYRATAVNVATTSESGAGELPRRVNAAFVSASVFRVLRATPAMGRGLSEQDDQPGAAPVAAISRRLWEQQFAADPRVLDRLMIVDGVPRRIIAVMPEDFQFPNSESALWIPLQLDPANTKSAAFDYRVVARLRDGASLATAAANLQRLLPRVPKVFPGRLSAAAITATHMQAVVRPLRDVVVGDVGRVLWIVFGAVAVLLILSCANVANLFLARAESRQRELAVRSALGAAHRQLLAELLSEALVVAAAGGVLGLVCAAVGLRALQSIGAAVSIPRLSQVHLDQFVFTLTTAIAALSALVVSALPLLRLNAASLVSMLVAGGRSSTRGRSHHRARRALVIAQVALALVLVFGAALFAHSFARLRAVDPGFTPDRALTFRVALPDAAYPGTRDAARMIVRSLDAIAAVPGVRGSGVITKLPLDAESSQDSAVFVEDHPTPKGGIPDLHEINFTTPGYFGAMGIPLLAGRLFDAPDAGGGAPQGPPEVIVSAAFAARYWRAGPASALGKRVRMNPTDPWHTIVGIVANVRGNGLELSPTEEVYCPLVTISAAGTPWAPRNLAFVIRTTADPSSIAASVRRAMTALDPALPLDRVRPLSDLVRAATARTSFTILLLAIAAMVATTLGAFGIYGVISYLVTLRTNEIGVRLALGAEARDVRLLVAGQAMTDALIGVAIGVVAAVLLARGLRAAVANVSPTDAAALSAASALLLVVAIAASWFPARRASRLDPSLALRNE